MASHRLTVQDLANQTSLGVRVVVPGDLSRLVLGAHTIEIEHADDWLEPGFVMLTTGMRFVGVADASASQESLVAGLVARGVAGLLFGVGVHFDRVPSGLIAAARAHDLPLLSVASDVPFLVVEKFVNQMLLSVDAWDLKQRLQLQTDLIETLAARDPVKALVHRLGALLNGTAILYEESGRVVASTGGGPALLIWGEIQSAKTRALDVVVGRWHVAARPIQLRGVGYWIALGSRRADVLAELAEPTLDATQRLLGAIRGIRSLSTTQAVAESAQILRIMRSGMTPDVANRTWDRLRAFRFQQQLPLRCFVTVGVRDQPATASGMGWSDPADAALDLAQELGLPLIMDAEGDRGSLIGLVGENEGVEAWCHALAQHFHVGLSEPYLDLHDCGGHFADADRALGVARRRAGYRASRAVRGQRGERPGMVVRFEDVDLASWLLSSRAPAAVAAKTRQQFAGLFGQDDLVATLIAYFNCGMDVKAAAERMFLHPNSVRYRLRRVEEILEAPLSSAAVIANLYLALHQQLTDENHTGATEVPQS